MDKNLEKWAREQYLDSLEDADKQERYKHAINVNDQEEEFFEREYKIIKRQESLSANGFHVIRI